jgi:hypothetical protein
MKRREFITLLGGVAVGDVIVVTTTDGKERIGSAPNTGDSIRVARELLRKHHDGTKKKGWGSSWFRS